MQNNVLLGFVVVLILFVISLGLNIYQSKQILNLNNQVTGLNNQVNDLNNKTETANSKIRAYFQAEGKECAKEAELCLDEFTAALKIKIGPDCSPVVDWVCPAWCKDPPGGDADCCVEAGMQWIPGRGCFNK